MKKLLPLVALLCIITIVNSCKKGNTGPTGPAGPSFKGVINGYVSVYDQYGSKTYVNLNNIQLTLKGGVTKNADINGYFYFDSVATGTYSIMASGSTFASTMVNNIGFVKDTFFQNIKLSLKPTFNLESFHSYHNTGSEYDSLIITVPADSRPRNLIVFAHNNRSVSNEPGHYLLSYIKSIPATTWGTTNVLVRIHAKEFNNANIFYGEQTYFAAYSYVVGDMSVYVDPATGKEAYNAVGTPLLDSAIAP